MERQVFESSALKEVLHDAVDAGKTAAADAMDKTADILDEHPEMVEIATEVGLAAFGAMSEDKGNFKAPKIRTKGTVKADKVLAKGYAAAAKPLAKGLRTVAGKMRGKSGGAAAAATNTPIKTHGNSRQYVGDTHVYVVRDAEGNIHKIGESMRGFNKNGKSIRAETQRRKLERQSGKLFETEIRETFPTKDAARQWETRTIRKYRNYFGADKLPGNKGNR